MIVLIGKLNHALWIESLTLTAFAPVKSSCYTDSTMISSRMRKSRHLQVPKYNPDRASSYVQRVRVLSFFLSSLGDMMGCESQGNFTQLLPAAPSDTKIIVVLWANQHLKARGIKFKYIWDKNGNDGNNRNNNSSNNKWQSYKYVPCPTEDKIARVSVDVRVRIPRRHRQ